MDRDNGSAWQHGRTIAPSHGGRFRPIITLFALTISLPVPPAVAQTANDASGDVLVTAQRRPQRAQDVPAAVSVITGDQLSRPGANDTSSLQDMVPSLMAPTSGAPGEGLSLRLRGFGSPLIQLGIEPAVGVFVDQVYRSRSGVSQNDLIDIERIEVLKGPQGTLFGQNTIAGLVHIVTQQPLLNRFEGWAAAELESYERVRLSGAVNLPIGERAAARLAGAIAEGAGSIRYLTQPGRQNDLDRYQLRGQLRLAPTDHFDLTVAADASHINEACCATLRLTGYLPALGDREGPSPAPGPEERITSINEDQRSRVNEWGASANAVARANGLSLSSITSYRDFRNRTLAEGDFSSADILAIRSAVAIRSFSQELRITGKVDMPATGDPLNWTVGGYYAAERIGRSREYDWQSQAALYLPASLNPVAGLGALDMLRQYSHSYAAFGDVDLPLASGLRVSAGLRYNIERKKGEGRFLQPRPVLLPVVNPQFSARLSETAPSWSASVQYRWIPALMTYANVSHGYKAGGINLAREASGLAGKPSDPLFRPENVHHVELGVKADLSRPRMQINVAAFRDNYDNLQSQIFIPPIFIVRNGGAANARGIELESEMVVVPGVKLSLAVAGLDTRFGAGTDLGYGDVAGARLPWAPKWTERLGLGIRRPIGNSSLSVFSTASLLLRSGFRAGANTDSAFEQGATQFVTMQVGLASARWTVGLGCSNCLNEHYAEVIFNNPLDPRGLESYPGQPRIYGLKLDTRF